MSIQTVGVIGAGVMGVGVAQNLAQAGYNVILVDIADDILHQEYPPPSHVEQEAEPGECRNAPQPHHLDPGVWAAD
jgi:3-hydroxyacyl-CoA dehydrogenase